MLTPNGDDVSRVEIVASRLQAQIDEFLQRTTPPEILEAAELYPQISVLGLAEAHEPEAEPTEPEAEPIWPREPEWGDIEPEA